VIATKDELVAAFRRIDRKDVERAFERMYTLVSQRLS
jgi:hypothetical protein